MFANEMFKGHRLINYNQWPHSNIQASGDYLVIDLSFSKPRSNFLLFSIGTKIL